MGFDVMPIDLRAFERRSLPIFNFRNPKENKRVLLDFIKNVKNSSLLYLTEDLEVGQKYIDSQKNKASIEFLENTASDELAEGLNLALDSLSQNKVKELLLESVYPEPGSTIPHTNSLYVVHPLEIDVDLHQFGGRVNGKKTEDIYLDLVKSMDARNLEDIKNEIMVPWEGDTLHIEAHPKASWQAIVNVDTFLAKVEDNLERAVGE